MRTFVLGLLVTLSVGSANAQTRDCTSHPVLSAGTIGVGVAAGALAGRITYDSEGASMATLLIAEGGYAVGIGVGAPLVGAALGCRGSTFGAARGALIGGAIGVGVTAGLLALSDRQNLDAVAGSVILGSAVAVIVPTALGIGGYDARPTVRPALLSAPTGERAAGASLRLGL